MKTKTITIEVIDTSVEETMDSDFLFRMQEIDGAYEKANNIKINNMKISDAAIVQMEKLRETFVDKFKPLGYKVNGVAVCSFKNSFRFTIACPRMGYKLELCAELETNKNIELSELIGRTVVEFSSELKYMSRSFTEYGNDPQFTNSVFTEYHGLKWFTQTYKGELLFMYKNIQEQKNR